MADIIHLFDGRNREIGNLITSAPFEFRRPRWISHHFLQILRSEARELDKKAAEKGRISLQLPEHFKLTGSVLNTILALFAHRTEEKAMREVYYLTGLIDCMINRVNPVLRTDLLRDMYRRIFELRDRLDFVLYMRPLDKVLLPIHQHFFDEDSYRADISAARSMKALYSVIREGTAKMFEILSENYSFYCPSSGILPHGCF